MVRSFITWTLHPNITIEIKPRWISRLQNVLEQTLPIVHRISLVNNQFRIAAMMQILTPCLLVNITDVSEECHSYIFKLILKYICFLCVLEHRTLFFVT